MCFYVYISSRVLAYVKHEASNKDANLPLRISLKLVLDLTKPAK